MNVRLCADGAAASGGADGQGWSGSASTACDGRRGGDGQCGGRGGDAGVLDVVLGIDGGMVRISGTSTGGGPAQHAFALGEADVVVLAARGGDGGSGGDAGRGEDGGRGRDGSDATRYANGSDGGPGGRGGDAGEPAAGGDSGAGGTVRLTVAEDDSDLLAACWWDVGAGAPGRAGRGASGGRGGEGGRGGSSHSWTESYQDTETYRDSQGHTQTRSVTKQRSHRNAGGSDGPRGGDGRSSSRSAPAGRSASAGTLAITMRCADGMQVAYSAPWAVELLAVTLEPVDARLFDGDRFEPGQELRVACLIVRNAGGMPTPTTRDLEVRVENGSGVECLAPAILARGIAPGATVELRDTALRLRLVDRRTVQAEPYEAKVELAFRLVVPRLQRAVAAPLVHPVVLASPIVLEVPNLYNALGLGERTDWTWTVVNRSLLPFGAATRAVATRVATPGGDAAADALSLSRDGVAQVWDGRRDAIDVLPPGGSATIAYHLAWRDGVCAFSGRDLAVALDVSRRDGLAQELQLRADRIKVAAAYRKTPEAAVLLIANHGTAVAEVEAWTAFLAGLGLEADVLDLSHEGSVDLDQRFSPTQSLREEWRGRTIVALNNIFDAPGGGRQSCADYLYDRQVVSSILDDGISWYVPGDGRPLFTAAALLASRRRSRRCERREVEAATLADTAIPDDAVLELSVVQDRHFGSPATAETLARLAEAWARRLAVDHPAARWLLVHRAAPERESGGWWRARWRLGTIEVLPLPGLGDAGLAVLDCPGERLHDVAQVRSPENQAALILALPFSEKLRLFTGLVVAAYNFDLVPERRALAEAYADAIVAELALEQELVRGSAGSWAAWSLASAVRVRAEAWCGRWRQLCTTGFIAALPANSERGHVLAVLIGRLRALIAVYSPWWRALLPGSRHAEITAQCRHLLDGLERNAFGSGKPLFALPDEPWVDVARNLAQARSVIATEAHRIAATMRPDDPPSERFLAIAAPEVPLAVCTLRRLPDQLFGGVVPGTLRDAAATAQDSEDAATAARSGAHREERKRLVESATS